MTEQERAEAETVARVAVYGLKSSILPRGSVADRTPEQRAWVEAFARRIKVDVGFLDAIASVYAAAGGDAHNLDAHFRALPAVRALILSEMPTSW